MGCQMGLLAFILAAFCFSSTLQTSEESFVPVLLWNYQNSGNLKFSHNSLHNVETDGFTHHLEKIIKKSSNPFVLAFVEPTLSVEDFSQHPVAFSKIKEDVANAKLVDYSTSVEEAPKALHDLDNAGFKVKEISDKESVVDNIDGVDVLIVKMSEPDDNRFNTLVNHDAFMADAYEKVLEQRKNVLGVLTGDISVASISSLIRYRRAADGAADNQTDMSLFNRNLYVAGNKNGRTMLLPNTAAVLSLPTGNKITLTKDEKTEVKIDDRPDYQRLLVTHFTVDNSKIFLRFRFDKDMSNTWSLKLVEVESPKLNIDATNLTTSTSIFKSVGQPFSTNKEVEFSNDANIKLVFPDGFMAQPWIPEALGLQFGETEDTVQYFTPGIWMGIFVMAILSLVFTLGLVMIMDIHTMDRFDDAKGKTITINVTD